MRCFNSGINNVNNYNALNYKQSLNKDGGSPVATNLMRNSNITPENLRGYYLTRLNPISFGHSMEDHSSYGVTFKYDDDGNIVGSQSKIYTYPNLKHAEIQVCKDTNEDFLDDYKSENEDPDKIKSFNMENTGNGIYECENPNIEPGDRYRFKLTFKDDSQRYISDLYSYNQKSLTGWPVAYDNKSYEKSPVGQELRNYTSDWDKGIISGKVDNIKSINDKNFISSKNLRLMQVHLGTFTKDGNFESAIKKLNQVKKLGFNGIELLPHGFFENKNWGYDPAFVFASQYGGTDKFKKFCDESHKRGLNVIVDVVNNHYSMDHPEIMTEAGPYENPDPNMKLEFGPRINYTSEGKNGVRDWRVNESLYWLKEGADGIRYDLSDFTGSGEFNTQLNVEIQEHFPGTATFAESASREASTPLPEETLIKDLDKTSEERGQLHENIIKKAQNNEFGPNRQGYTHQWHFDWSHAVEYSMLHPFNRNIDNLKTQVYDAQHQMKIMFSHDEIGKQEADGNDVVQKIMLSKLFGSDVGDLGWGASRGKVEKYWKASRAARELTKAYLTDTTWPDNEKQLASEKCENGKDINDYNNEEYGIPDYKKGGLGLSDLGWETGISKKEFGEKFQSACNLNKAAMGFLFSQPGPKMVFQSFDKPDNRFAFFRKNSDFFYKTFNRTPNVIEGVDWETERKGHRIDSDKIIEQAKIDNLNPQYNGVALNYQHSMGNLISKLNKLVDNNPALSDGKVTDVVGNHKNVISIATKCGDNEIYSITHFDDSKDYDNYEIHFPEGQWKEILNTDAKEFGGSGNLSNEDVINGGNDCSIKLPKASTLIFKKVD